MEEKILERAISYVKQVEEKNLINEELRAKSPILFVLLGDEVKEGLPIVKKRIEEQIVNSKGVVYLHIGSEGACKPCSSYVEEEGIYSFTLPFECEDEKVFRGRLTQALLENRALLQALNRSFSKVKQAILGHSKMFAEWEQVNVVFITGADDPLNVLLPDVTALVKHKLEETFKQVFVDLFVLIEEGQKEKAALSKAMTFSFFEELDSYQSSTFSYSRPIEVLDEAIQIEITYEHKLFDQVYIMTDQTEKGQKPPEVVEGHYETIAALQLLKNRLQKSLELEEASEQYNNAVFIHNTSYEGEHRYASARLAKVRKPDMGIYMAVAYHLYDCYKKTLCYEDEEAAEELLYVAGLSEGRLGQCTHTQLPGREALENIHSIMSHKKSFRELKNITFKEAESLLYGGACETFFEEHFVKTMESFLSDKAQLVAYKERLEKEIINDYKFGPYAIVKLATHQVTPKLDTIKAHHRDQMAQLEEAIREQESLVVGQCIGSKIGLLDHKYVRDTKKYIVENIYELKYKKLQEHFKLRLIAYIEDRIGQLYEEIKADIQRFDSIGKDLEQLMIEANRFEEEYLVQNVNEYYKKVTADQVFQLERARGKGFFNEERMMGEVSKVLKMTKESFFERLFQIEEKYILPDLGLESFETELLARANVATKYEDDAIVAKSELYHMLYESLEENSKVCVYLDGTSSHHRYEEKYFFGDRESEFMSYAYKKDQSSRNYKLGYIRVNKSSRLEKLQLMGGFRLEDLVLTKTAKRYYEVYVQEGYVFHSTI